MYHDICPNLLKNIHFLARKLRRKYFQEEINSTEVYSEPGQTSNTIFTKIINAIKSLTIFAKTPS